MAATAIPLSNVDAYAAEIDQRSFWLRNRRWDLFFITLSVIVVPLPYLMYLLGVHSGAGRRYQPQSGEYLCRGRYWRSPHDVHLPAHRAG